MGGKQSSFLSFSSIDRGSGSDDEEESSSQNESSIETKTNNEQKKTTKKTKNDKHFEDDSTKRFNSENSKDKLTNDTKNDNNNNIHTQHNNTDSQNNNIQQDSKSLPINDIESVDALSTSPLSPIKNNGLHVGSEVDEKTLSWIRASKEAEDIEIEAISNSPPSRKRRVRRNTAPPSTTPRTLLSTTSSPIQNTSSQSSSANSTKEEDGEEELKQEKDNQLIPNMAALSLKDTNDESLSKSAPSKLPSLVDNTEHTPTPRPDTSSSSPRETILPTSPSSLSTSSTDSSIVSNEKPTSPSSTEYAKLGPVERWRQIEKPELLSFENLLDYLDKGLEAERIADVEGDSPSKSEASEMVSNVMEYITSVATEQHGKRRRHRTLTIVRPLISVRKDDIDSVKRSYRTTELIVEPPNNEIYVFVRKNIERIIMQVIFPLQSKELNNACIFHIGAVLQMSTAVFPKHLTQMCIEGNLIMELFLPHLHRSPMIDVITAILFQGGMEADSDDSDDEVSDTPATQLESKIKDKSLGSILTALHGHLAEKRFFTKLMQMAANAALKSASVHSETHEISSASTELFAEIVRTLGPNYPIRILINRWEMESLRNTLGMLVRAVSAKNASLSSRTFCAETLFNLTVCLERLSMKITDARLRPQVQTFTGSLFITLQMLFPQICQSLTVDSEPGVSTLQLHCVDLIENTLKYFGQYHGAQHLQPAAGKISKEAWNFIIDRFFHHDNCSLLHCAFTRIVCRLVVHRASHTIDHLLKEHDLLERLVDWHERHPQSPVKLHILTVLSVLAKKQEYLLQETRERMDACEAWKEFLETHRHDIEILDVPFEDTAVTEDSGTVFSDSSSDSAEILSEDDEEF